MTRSFYVTLRKKESPNITHIISPEYKDIVDASIFATELANRLDYANDFKMSGDDGTVHFNDDIIIKVEQDSAYIGIPLEQFDEEVFEGIFNQIEEFLLRKPLGQE
ncbi:hypothetical protein A33Q_0185 [Indibacter alkaliphilus LW1]|uniref:Uncharacterized protein n=1 Tax=Indibacter alkaliphilus (strain CCUG 57479 / KCTC 22604 / LW1) TaxID=1189612 RepID=S2E5V6_INDAL|nr:hypothetical protein [Indibacter alkaliphilus]EPA00017.1 hypothetical protein A33Q_0185 [Indibacter alkaliphilus LW1]